MTGEELVEQLDRVLSNGVGSLDLKAELVLRVPVQKWNGREFVEETVETQIVIVSKFGGRLVLHCERVRV